MKKDNNLIEHLQTIKQSLARGEERNGFALCINEIEEYFDKMEGRICRIINSK